jgi:hypothetical protein
MPVPHESRRGCYSRRPIELPKRESRRAFSSCRPARALPPVGRKIDDADCQLHPMLDLLAANPDGQSENGLAKAVPPKQRIIDLRVGDWLRFRDKVRKINRRRGLPRVTVGRRLANDTARGLHRARGRLTAMH